MVPDKISEIVIAERSKEITDKAISMANSSADRWIREGHWWGHVLAEALEYENVNLSQRLQ